MKCDFQSWRILARFEDQKCACQTDRFTYENSRASVNPPVTGRNLIFSLILPRFFCGSLSFFSEFLLPPSFPILLFYAISFFLICPQFPPPILLQNIPYC